MTAIVEGEGRAPLVRDSQPGVASMSVEEAQEKAKVAVEKKAEADKAAADAHLATFTPEQQKAMDARREADKAAAEAATAAFQVQQAKANRVLEHKLGRKLKEGEYARWVSGDRNNLREENLELASPEIIALENRTGRHVSGEDLLDYEMNGEESAAVRAYRADQHRVKGE